MIYILQVRQPWISNDYWQSVAAFISTYEAKQTELWQTSDPDYVRLLEIAAIGTLGCLVESYYPEDDSCN